MAATERESNDPYGDSDDESYDSDDDGYDGVGYPPPFEEFKNPYKGAFRGTGLHSIAAAFGAYITRTVNDQRREALLHPQEEEVPKWTYGRNLEQRPWERQFSREDDRAHWPLKIHKIDVQSLDEIVSQEDTLIIREGPKMSREHVIVSRTPSFKEAMENLVEIGDPISAKTRGNRNRERLPRRKLRGRGRRQDDFNPRVQSVTRIRSPLLASELKVPMVLDGDFTIPGGSTTGSYRFNPNSLFSPNVTGGGTGNLPSYAAYSLMYGFYRVMSYSYVIRCVNNEAFPVAVFVTNSDNDYGTAPAIGVAANPLSQRRTLGPLTGSCMAVLRKRVTVPEIAGTNAVATSDSYRALNNANPADLMWLGISAASMTGTALSVSVRFEIHLVMNALWFDRLQQ